MNQEEINDKRMIAEFKGISFSKYKKSEVVKEFLKAVNSSNIEAACYWSAELICAGHYIDLWDNIFLLMSDNIHLGNPKLPIYIDLRLTNFKELLNNGYIGNELALRNNQKIRQLFAEMIIVLCLSKKKHKMESVKINKNEFEIVNIPTKLKAPNVEFISEYFKPEDAKELFIMYNEFAFQLSNQGKNALMACYWFEWIIQFNQLCKKKKDDCLCARRSFVPVEEKFQMHPVWLIWEILIDFSKKKSKLIHKIIMSLLNLFCAKFSLSSIKKRKFIIYFAISLIVEKIDLKVDIISNQDILEKINKKIGKIYIQVKKNEISPDTDYLFNGVEQSNIEKSMKKIETMNSLFLNNDF